MADHEQDTPPEVLDSKRDAIDTKSSSKSPLANLP